MWDNVNIVICSFWHQARVKKNPFEFPILQIFETSEVNCYQVQHITDYIVCFQQEIQYRLQKLVLSAGN